MARINGLIDELRSQGITDPSVLETIASIPREKFVLADYKARAFDNTALPIGCQQTISQPYVVALMTQALCEYGARKILEIGTGSGYQTAVLAKLFPEVWTIERIGPLLERAKKTLTELGVNNVHFRLGDGSQGWPEHAPYEGIIVTAAAMELPKALLAQLDPNGGVMVIPLGRTHQVQKLTLVEKNQDHINQSTLELVCFVPLIEDGSVNSGEG